MRLMEFRGQLLTSRCRRSACPDPATGRDPVPCGHWSGPERVGDLFERSGCALLACSRLRRAFITLFGSHAFSLAFKEETHVKVAGRVSLLWVPNSPKLQKGPLFSFSSILQIFPPMVPHAMHSSPESLLENGVLERGHKG